MNDNDPTPAVITAGALFSTGPALEQIAGGRFLCWQRSQARTATSFTLLNRTFVPASLDPNLEATLQLSDGTLEFQAPEELLSELSGVFEKGANLESSSARLIASFVVSTWVPEALPARPILNLWGPCGSEDGLWRMLLSVVRRPLQLADCSLPELARLAQNLHPTLMLFDPKAQVLDKLLAASRTSSLGLLRRGQLSPVGYATVVCTTSPVEAPALCLSLPRFDSQRPRVTPAEQEALRARFAPRLLAYRLSHHRAVATAKFSVPGLTPATATVARSLTAAVSAAPNFQQQLAADLQNFDNSAKVQKSEEPAAIVLEALLALVHQHHTAAAVREITENANAIFFGRDEGIEITARKVGHILRQELGLYPQRKGPGFELPLDRATCTRIHELAQGWAVLSLQNPQPDCPLCETASAVQNPASVFSPASSLPRDASADVLNGHDHAELSPQDVHEVHDVNVGNVVEDALVEAALVPIGVSANPDSSNVHDVHDVHVEPSQAALEAPPISGDDLLLALFGSLSAPSPTHAETEDTLALPVIAIDRKSEDLSALVTAASDEGSDDRGQDVDFDSFPGMEAENEEDRSWQEVS